MRSRISLTGRNNECIDSALRVKLRRWKAGFYIAFAFLTAAVLFAAAAVKLTACGFSLDPVSDYFRHILLVLVFPAAFFTAHCMDRVREVRTAIRNENFDRNGIRTGGG